MRKAKTITKVLAMMTALSMVAACGTAKETVGTTAAETTAGAAPTTAAASTGGTAATGASASIEEAAKEGKF